MAVTPDIEHPISAAVDIAKKIPGAALEEIALPNKEYETDAIEGGDVVSRTQRISRHCFELHSDVVASRILNFLIDQGTAPKMDAPYFAKTEISHQGFRDAAAGSTSTKYIADFNHLGASGVCRISPLRNRL